MRIAPALTSTFLLAKLIGDILTKSLALISDAVHMLTDAAALAITLTAIQTGKRPADKQQAFGYYRFEILAAASNTLLPFGVALYILYETYQRLHAPAEVQSLGMLGTATIGLVVNIISMQVPADSQEQSLSIKGTCLEAWNDLLGSIGVIFATIVIQFTDWTWVDSAIATPIELWVLPCIWILFKSSINILLKGVPEDIDLPSVEQALLTIPGVRNMRDLHVWSLTSGKTSLTVHLVNEPAVNPKCDILPVAQDRLAERFGITYITIQFELRLYAQADAVIHFQPDEPIAAATSDQPDEHHGHQEHSH